MDASRTAETIKRLRVAGGYKAADDLAAASGISVSVLQNLESGRKKSLTTDVVVALCQTLNVSPYEFLPELDPGTDEAAAARQARRKLIEQLLRMT